jgi:predicted transcriptional regulator of viral defense system
MHPRSPTQVIDRRVSAFGAENHDVASVDQLRALGMTDDRIDTRVASGRLYAVHRGVYAIGRRRLSREGVWLAAVLAAGPGAVLSHRSAAAHWGLVGGDGARVDVTIPTRNGRARRPGLAIHRPRRFPARDECTFHEGIAVTTPARTLLDVAGVLGRTAVARALERAEQLRLFDLRAIEQVIAAHAPRPNARRLVQALDIADPAPTRRELERLMLALCRAHGLPRPEVNVLVADLEVDFLWRHAGLVVETDGFETHGTRAAFERDRVRDATLAVAGFRVIRFTWRRVTREPDAVGATIRALLGGGAGSPAM